MDVIGSFDDLTRGNVHGKFTDAAFPTHTPLSKETFS
jgi:hypothetical protein